jgi:formylglycine-generating enzyme required for sulfatase activity
VSWEDAVDFCRRLSELPAEKAAGRAYRLPTEAEWEYACRAGTTTAFWWGGSATSTHANFNGNDPYGGAPKGPYLQRTTKVGSYQPNPWGLFDTLGNVREWCADWYDEGYYRISPRQDPRGPDTGKKKCQRGGGWADVGNLCRIAIRLANPPTERNALVGFRVVCTVQGTRKEGR